MSFRRFLLSAAATAALVVLPQLTQAQLIANATQGQAAHDSVLARATHYHQLIEQRAGGFRVSAKHLGQRRRVVRGYFIQKSNLTSASGSKHRAWKHVTRTLRTGVVRERYVGYLNQQKVLEETRTNQQLNYVRVSQLMYVPNTKLVRGRAPLGLLTKEGYVQWNREQYVLTQPGKL